MSERKPTEVDAIDQALDGLLARIRTATPGEVITYNPATQRADVQPSIKLRMVDGKIRSMPPVTSAPVLWPRFGGFRIEGELAPGDTVLLIVCDRSIDKWRSKGGLVDPVEARKHSITDAVVLPSLWPDIVPMTGRAVGELLVGAEDGRAGLRIAKTGTVVIEAATEIKFGTAATEGLVKGAVFRSLYNSHTHTAPSGGGTTTTPLVPMPASQVSTKAKTE